MFSLTTQLDSNQRLDGTDDWLRPEVNQKTSGVVPYIISLSEHRFWWCFVLFFLILAEDAFVQVNYGWFFLFLYLHPQPLHHFRNVFQNYVAWNYTINQPQFHCSGEMMLEAWLNGWNTVCRNPKYQIGSDFKLKCNSIWPPKYPNSVTE